MSERALLIRAPTGEWARTAYESLLPGGYACVFGSFHVALEAEDHGFVIRDCFQVLGLVCFKVWLIRRPLSEATVTQQVLSTQTGALWIDGCRTHSGPSTGGSISGQSAFGQDSGWNAHENRPTQIDRSMTAGRWPPNLLLMHTPGCEMGGTQRVLPGGGGKARREKGVTCKVAYGGNIGRMPPGTPDLGYVDPDGLETILSWDCQPGCPVPVLDQQSRDMGMHGAGNKRPTLSGGPFIEGGWKKLLQNPDLYGDAHTGGASRFFPQFTSEAELDAWLTRLILGTQTPPLAQG